MVKSLIPINPTNNNAVVANARDWYGYFNFLNSYVEEGLELTSISNVDIQIGLGRSRIKGLVFSVTTAESIAVTGNNDRYLHARIIEADGNPTGIALIFLNEISALDTDLFLGKVMLNGDNTGFDIDMLSVPRNSGIRNDFFGDGRDGDVVLANGDSIDSDKQYRNLKITGTVSVANNISIIVKENCEIDGTLVCRGIVLGGVGGHGTRGLRADPIRGDGISGSVGNTYENIVGGGSNGTGIQNGGSNGSGVIGFGGVRSKSIVSISKAFSVFGKIVNIASGCGGGGGDTSSQQNTSPLLGADGGDGVGIDGDDGSHADGSDVPYQAGGGGGQGGSGAGIIRILATYILYGDNAILDVRGGNGGDGGRGGIRVSSNIEYGGKGGIGSGGDGGIVAVFSKSDKGFDTSKFLIGKGLKGVVVDGYDDGNATDGSDGQVWRGFV